MLAVVRSFVPVQALDMMLRMENRASWGFALLLFVAVGVYIALNWESVIPPLSRILASFFR